MESHAIPLMNEIEQDVSLEDLQPYFQLTDPSLLETIQFEGSRLFTEFMTTFEWANWKRWNQVAPHLYLGKLPSFNQSQQLMEEIRSKGGKLGLVVSVTGYHELAGYRVDPPSYWKEEQVKQCIVPMPDFSAHLSNELLIEAIRRIDDTIAQGKEVYIHCKAGRSRSALFCLIYLYFRGDQNLLQISKEESEIRSDIKRIEDYLKQVRPQVGLLSSQREKAVEVIRILRKSQLDKKETPSFHEHQDVVGQFAKQEINLKEAVQSILSSLQMKYEIVHFTSFMQMAYYAFNHQASTLSKLAYSALSGSQNSNDSPQTKYIKAFFLAIYHANRPDWFLELTAGQGPLEKLVNLDVYSLAFWESTSDKTERMGLRENFIQETYQYLAETLGCDVEAIQSVITTLRQERNLNGGDVIRLPL